jgi:hypothetical protein
MDKTIQYILSGDLASDCAVKLRIDKEEQETCMYNLTKVDHKPGTGI